MSRKEIKLMVVGFVNVIAFGVWTLMIKTIDVKPIGTNGTDVGFATLNRWFHNLTEVNMTLYNITDWLGIIPVFVCMIFSVVGIVQLIKRRNLFIVDYDILLLGLYYVVVILCYLVFELIPINYRPILINGFMEASYPSSTTLLVLAVMPTVVFQSNRRIENNIIKKIICVIIIIFTLFMVIARSISGVHWITDIIGSILLSTGLFFMYKTAVLMCDKKIGGMFRGIS